ncbi:MAG: LapA family protein [Tagaea sp.]|nr:LapA family protein [Tagaea sp.]
MRALYWILAGALAALAGLFALNNRGELTVDFWPVGPELQMPIFVALVGALYLGFALGALVMWFATGRARSRARAATRKAAELDADLQALKARDAAQPPAVAPPSPAA